MKQAEQISQDLLAEYFRLLRFKGASNGIFRVPPKVLERLEAAIQRPGNGVLHKLNYQVVLDSNPLQKLLDASCRRLLRTVRVHGINQACPCFVGLFTHRAFDARCVATPSGNLILVNSGALSVTLDLLWSAILDVMADSAEDEQDSDDMTADEYVRMVLSQPHPGRDPFDLFESYLQNKQLPEIFAPGRGAWSMLWRSETGLIAPNHWLEIVFVAAAQPCVDFFVAHEYGHLLAGHIMLQEDASRNVTEECEADRIAVELLSEVWPGETAIPCTGEGKLSLLPPQMVLFNLALARLFERWEVKADSDAAAVDFLFHSRQLHTHERLKELSPLNLGKIPFDTIKWLSAVADAYTDEVGKFL